MKIFFTVGVSILINSLGFREFLRTTPILGLCLKTDWCAGISVPDSRIIAILSYDTGKSAKTWKRLKDDHPHSDPKFQCTYHNKSLDFHLSKVHSTF